VLFVDDSCEYLINHPTPSSDFINTGYDSILKVEVFARHAKYPSNLLATFPAVGGESCIVIGTPEKTGLSTTPWIITLLHEHFHHYESNDPSYYSDVQKLKLSKGDSTGMWMLNYAFPYDSFPVVRQFHQYTQALYDAVTSLESDSFEILLREYAKERTAFKRLLYPSDYRYFSFQVWQEGIARYTEYKLLDAMNGYKPSASVQALADYIPFDVYRERLYKVELKKLIVYKLPLQQRECFYAVGFAEGLLLDYLNPRWRKQFLKEKFFMERY
jgi:hypothetical protein